MSILASIHMNNVLGSTGMFIVLVIVYVFFNPGTTDLFKKSSPTNVFVLDLGLKNRRARGRLTEFRFVMAYM